MGTGVVHNRSSAVVVGAQRQTGADFLSHLEKERGNRELVNPSMNYFTSGDGFFYYYYYYINLVVQLSSSREASRGVQAENQKGMPKDQTR